MRAGGSRFDLPSDMDTDGTLLRLLEQALDGRLFNLGGLAPGGMPMAPPQVPVEVRKAPATLRMADFGVLACQACGTR
jgi:hypothetical protein